jgi:DMSO reductase anchor subunit
MTELWSSLVVFLLLCGSAVVGFFIQRLLPERHRTRESIELVHLAIGMLVTFAALVLGLLTASVKKLV